MKDSDYITYRRYLKNKRIDNQKTFISKTKNSYIVGPKIDLKFNEDSFKKRLLSSSLYDIKIYKNISKIKAKRLITQFYSQLKSNEIIEIFRNKKTVKYTIIPIPGEIYEKE